MTTASLPVLLLTRTEVASLLTLDDHIEAVEGAFRAHALGEVLPPGLMHVDAHAGEFHIKAGGVLKPRAYFALKANGGFFQNTARFGLPNIQGLILLYDAEKGSPLAVMDSTEITRKRTGAAVAAAAKHLAREDSFREAVFLAVDILKKRENLKDMSANPLKKTEMAKER